MTMKITRKKRKAKPATKSGMCFLSFGLLEIEARYFTEEQIRTNCVQNRCRHWLFRWWGNWIISNQPNRNSAHKKRDKLITSRRFARYRDWSRWKRKEKWHQVVCRLYIQLFCSLSSSAKCCCFLCRLVSCAQRNVRDRVAKALGGYTIFGNIAWIVYFCTLL